MPTINQLIKKPRRALGRINKVKDLEASPQKRGVCLQVKTMTPKKPNSALRKIARWVSSARSSPKLFHWTASRDRSKRQGIRRQGLRRSLPGRACTVMADDPG